VEAAGQVDRGDVGGGVGVQVLVEGVVSVRRAVRRRLSRRLHPEGAGRKDHRVADDRLGIGAAGPRAAGLVGQVTL